MHDDDPAYLEAMLRWMYCMHHGLKIHNNPKGLEYLVTLGDLARKYDVAGLVIQLNSDIEQVVNCSLTWNNDCITAIDHIFEVVGDSESWQILEDALVGWTCREGDKEEMFGDVDWEVFDKFLSRHGRPGRRIVIKLLMNLM
jgi:hypothetical protein